MGAQRDHIALNISTPDGAALPPVATVNRNRDYSIQSPIGGIQGALPQEATLATGGKNKRR